MMREGLIQIFRNRPALAVEVLRDLLHAEVPAYSTIELQELDLNEIKLSQYQPDLIVLLLDGAPVHAIVIETQLGRDPDKLFTWPVYLTHVRARLRCPTSLLVVAPDGAIARWCSKPIETGHPGFTLTPQVLGPDEVPVVTDPEIADQDPEVALLSVVAHGHGAHGLAIAKAVLVAVDKLDENRKALYTDLVHISVGDAVRKALEAMMAGGYEFQSDFAKTYFGRGRAEGEALGEARAVLLVLKARGLAVSEESRQRMLTCQDIAQLDRWAERAATVTDVAELFVEPAT
jgi:uncharacterized glyoxalase superfamily protein PhnB